MKLTSCLLAGAAMLVAGVPFTQAGNPPMQGLLHDIDTQILVDQYRHQRAEASKLEVELALQRVRLRHSKPVSDEQERELAIAGETLEVLRRMAAETREQILALRPAEGEADRARPSDSEAHQAGEQDMPRALTALQGRWAGREVGSNAGVEMAIEGQVIRFRLPSRGEWYVGRLMAGQPTDRDRVFAVDFAIEECVAPEYVGRTSKALVRLGGDRLTLAGNEPGREDRPADFEPEGDTRVFNFERVQREP